MPLALIVKFVTALMAGPFGKLIEAHVKDAELRRKIEAELQVQMLAELGKEAALGQAVVLAEVQSEHWLTRSWRPLLMMTLLGFLVLVGLVLPVADLIAGYPVPFNPRWSALPEGFWQFLSVGVGGYIGGRSVEKIIQKAPLPGPRRKA
ncbi:MAG: holin family protein [Proteobacteria bacterium]|nr:holin family protein [Pseudomonadota bacterium]